MAKSDTPSFAFCWHYTMADVMYIDIQPVRFTNQSIPIQRCFEKQIFVTHLCGKYKWDVQET